MIPELLYGVRSDHVDSMFGDPAFRRRFPGFSSGTVFRVAVSLLDHITFTLEGTEIVKANVWRKKLIAGYQPDRIILEIPIDSINAPTMPRRYNPLLHAMRVTGTTHALCNLWFPEHRYDLRPLHKNLRKNPRTWWIFP